MGTRLTRRETKRGHTYRLDGDIVSGVTTLIGKGLPKPALPYWSARTVAEYVADADPADMATLRGLGRQGMIDALKSVPWGQRDAAANRGTEVHQLAEQIMAGQEVDVPEPLVGHVDSYLRFLDDWQPEPIIVEGVVGSATHRYCGTLDLIADLDNGQRAILDWKTTRSGIWPETAYQLAAYRYAEFYSDGTDDHPVPEVDAGYAVWIRADGYDMIPVECGPEVFRAFLHIAWVAKRTENNKDLIGQAITAPPEKQP